jgi:hypothetical protein
MEQQKGRDSRELLFFEGMTGIAELAHDGREPFSKDPFKNNSAPLQFLRKDGTPFPPV